MSELQFVRIEGDSMVLRSPEGEEFVVPVDDVLRSEVRRGGQHSPTAQAISPREIQEAIRAGETIESLIEKHGAEAAYIEKFARPVLDELQHVINAAGAVRIQLAGDRFSDVTQIDFGDLIARRLDAAGANDVHWNSSRVDLTTWLVTVRFNLPHGPGHASWTFDPRKLTLTPENETALSLSSAEPLGAGPIPRLRPVTADGVAKHPSNTTAKIPVPETTPTAPVRATEQQPRPDTSNQPTVRLTPDQLPKPVEERSDNVAALPVRSTIKEAIAKAAEPSAETPDTEVLELASAEAGEVAPNPIELLDALRQKRQERESAATDELPHKVTGADRPLIPVSEPEPVTSAIRIVNDEPLIEAESSQLPAVEPEDEPGDDSEQAPGAASKVEGKRGRASIPSWDEIVFGTKTDEN
ncbi:MAG: hypothetical protein RL645_634 [Actinomycetota bacterium]|jgi:hypothetical protein